MRCESTRGARAVAGAGGGACRHRWRDASTRIDGNEPRTSTATNARKRATTNPAPRRVPARPARALPRHARRAWRPPTRSPNRVATRQRTSRSRGNRGTRRRRRPRRRVDTRAKRSSPPRETQLCVSHRSRRRASSRRTAVSRRSSRARWGVEPRHSCANRAGAPVGPPRTSAR